MTFSCVVFFFFNDTPTTEIYTLSLHDALPISPERPPHHGLERCPLRLDGWGLGRLNGGNDREPPPPGFHPPRSEEHTSELQSLRHLVCRLLLEKKKKKQKTESNQ